MFVGTEITQRNREILDKWLLQNRNHPYLKCADLFKLSIQTQLKTQTIKRWMGNQRSRRPKEFPTVKRRNYFTDEEKRSL